MVKLKKKVLKPNERVFYTPRTEKYGCAEFILCPIIKRGKITKAYLYPQQQLDAKNYFEFDCGGVDSFTISSWTHKGMENPNAWIYSWCVKHKTLSIRFYPPREANCFYISPSSVLTIQFEHEIEIRRGEGAVDG